MNRRTLLYALGSSGVLGGCAAPLTPGGDSESTATPAADSRSVRELLARGV